MKRSIKKTAINGFIAFTISVLISILTVQAQNETRQNRNSEYVISARAGGLNLVAGMVSVQRRGAYAMISIANGEMLENGDRLETGANSRAEILLNPGSYLRLGENSEIELTDSSLDSLRIKLNRGVAIIEAGGGSDKFAVIELQSNNAIILIDKKGVYRIENQTDSGFTLARTQKGRARVNGDEIKDGKEIKIVANGSAEIAKFDKKVQDNFDLWSSSRAETIATENKKLSDQTVSGLYSRYRNDTLSRNGRLGGYWLYNPLFRSRTFLPFSAGWSSPYGYRYNRVFGNSRSFGFNSFGRPGVNIGINVGHRQTIHHRTVHHRGGRRH